MYTLGRPLRSRCITSSLYVPEAVKMVPETVTCDIIAIGWIWDMLTFQSHAVSEPNGLPEAFWMLFRYVSRIGKIDVSKSFTAMRNFMKFPWDSHQTPGMKLPYQSKSCDTSSWQSVSRTSCSLQLGWQGEIAFLGCRRFQLHLFAVPGYGSCCRSVLQASGILAASDSLSPVVDWFWNIWKNNLLHCRLPCTLECFHLQGRSMMPSLWHASRQPNELSPHSSLMFP